MRRKTDFGRSWMESVLDSVFSFWQRPATKQCF